MAKILITGGAGFIGTHLAERLADANQIVLLDSFRRDSLSLAPHLKSHKNVSVVSGDVLDPATIKSALDGVEVVIHLAAIAGVSSYYNEPLRTLKVNVLGTVNVLEESSNLGVKTFVYFSTSEVFGPNALWVDEQSPHGIGPVSDKRWVYATSKLAGEHFVLRYGEQTGMGCTVVRPFNIYGPRQVGEGAISNFCRAVTSGQPMTVYGDGSAIRAWCYVSDLVEAVLAILKTPQASGQVFNIGNPREVETTVGLARRIVRLAPDSFIEHKDEERTEVRARIPVIDHARTVLGFEPKVSLDEGLDKTIHWFMQDGRK